MNLSDLPKLLPGESVEVMWGPLYDYAREVVAEPRKSIEFFQKPVGVEGRTLFDTNMMLGGSLPSPQVALITGIRVVVQCADKRSYVGAMSDAVLRLRIGSRVFLTDGPLFKFPPVFPVPQEFAIPTLSTDVGYFERLREFSELVKQSYYAITPLKVISNESFMVDLAFRETHRLRRLGVILDAFIYRPV